MAKKRDIWHATCILPVLYDALVWLGRRSEREYCREQLQYRRTRFPAAILESAKIDDNFRVPVVRVWMFSHPSPLVG